MLVSPSWTTYAPQCRLAGHEPIIVETSFESEWKVGPEALESALKRPGLQSNKLLVLNNPGNPCESTDNQHTSEEAVTNVLNPQPALLTQRRSWKRWPRFVERTTLSCSPTRYIPASTSPGTMSAWQRCTPRAPSSLQGSPNIVG